MTTPSPEQLQTQALEYVKQGQEAITMMVAAVQENLAGMMRGGAGQGATGLPSPAAAIDQAFDLTIQMVEAQRSFVHSLLDASGSVLGATAEPAGRTR